MGGSKLELFRVGTVYIIFLSELCDAYVWLMFAQKQLRSKPEPCVFIKLFL